MWSIAKPSLKLNIGGTARTADYQSHDGAEVVFAYTVQAEDSDDNWYLHRR